MANQYNTSDQAFLFKETWSDLSFNSYNSATPILSRVRKKFDLQGLKDHVAIPLGPAGGIGGLVNGYLPQGRGSSGGQMEITAKDVVGIATIDRKAMKASMTDKGSFVRFTKEPVERCVESYNTVCNILWHGNGTGNFATTDTTGYVSGGASAPVIQFSAATFHERWFPKNLQFNFANSGDTGVEDGLFAVTSVDATNRRVTFARESGTFDLSSGTNADSRKIYLQNMFKAAPMGLEGTVMKSSGTIYTLAYDATSWGSLVIDAAGKPPSVQLLNSAFSQQSTRVEDGRLPNVILTSPEVYSILQDIWEPTKRIMLMPRDQKLTKASGFGISGLLYETLEGQEVAIVKDKHCWKDRIYGLYDETMYMHHLPDQGWWDEDGKVFMRVDGRPWYSGTYGGYFENVINPQYQLAIDNLGIS